MPRSTDSTVSRRALAACVLVVVGLTIWAAALRLRGIDFGLPQRVEPDGGVLVRQAELLMGGSEAPWREANWFYYPHLLGWIVGPFLHGAPSGASVSRAAAAATHHLETRRVLALLAALIVPATFLFARRFVGYGAALLASASMSVSLLQTWFAQESRPHAGAALFALLAVFACVRARAGPSIASFLLAGLGVGAALGALQSGAPTLFALCAAFVLAERVPGARRPWLAGLLAFAVVLAVCACLYPFFRDTPDGAARPVLFDADGTWEFFGHSLFKQKVNGAGFATVAWTLLSFETPALVFALLAGAWAFVARAKPASPSIGASARRGDLVVVLAYVVPYTLALGLYERTAERFVLQLVPFVHVAAAAGVFACARAWGARRPRVAPLVIALGALLLCAPSAFACWRLTTLRKRPDTSELTAQWIMANVKRDERVILVPFVDVPLPRTRESVVADAKRGWCSPWRESVVADAKRGWCSPWLAFLAAHGDTLPAGPRWDLRGFALNDAEVRDAVLADPVSWLRANGARYAVLELPSSPEASPFHTALAARLARDAQLVQRLPSNANGASGEAVLGYEDLPRPRHVNWIWCLPTHFEVFGKAIEVYRVP
ncbi:MAG: glycosyltransferase family 39 protein [Planctomycetes bacterium]|nr:glycosyltransferase family 39 protein [Planctomycetota bacterium]